MSPTAVLRLAKQADAGRRSDEQLAGKSLADDFDDFDSEEEDVEALELPDVSDNPAAQFDAFVKEA